MTTPPSESTDQDENAVGGASGVDRITDNYRTILNELSLLATVSVLLFGFLLSVAARDATTTERWLLLTALICVSSSTLIFILPVAYHRLEFPYEDWNKFQRRSHYFITVGVPIFVAGVYLSNDGGGLGPPGRCRIRRQRRPKGLQRCRLPLAQKAVPIVGVVPLNLLFRCNPLTLG
jgi:hypothetical protein